MGAGTRTRRQRGTGRLRSALRRLRRALLRALLILFLLQLAVVGLYRTVDPPATPLMLWWRLQGRPVDHRPVTLARVSSSMRRAVLASEDSRFCRHHGFDWRELRPQLARLLRGEPARGASTVTMQTARNLLLWPGRDFVLVRKLLEAVVTVELELLWPKRRILEVYLNVAEFGPGIFGVEAAARRYFGIGAEALDARRAALLVSVLPAPRVRRPDRPSSALARRAAVIRARMRTLGDLADCVL